MCLLYVLLPPTRHIEWRFWHRRRYYPSEKLETGQASMARLSAPTALSCAEQHHAPSGNVPLNSTFHFADARSSYYSASPINYCFTRHQRRWGTDWRTSPAVQGSTPHALLLTDEYRGLFSSTLKFRCRSSLHTTYS